MSNGKMLLKTIDLTPTWETATQIYIACLENPNATEEGKQAARDDLMKMAKCLDAHIERAKTIDVKSEAE